MKTGFRAVSFPAVFIAHRAFIVARKTPNEIRFPGGYKIRNVRKKRDIRNTSSSRAKQYVCHPLSHCMNHVPLWMTVFEGCRSLVEARDDLLESLSKPLSIRPHLCLECTVPLTCVLLLGFLATTVLSN